MAQPPNPPSANDLTMERIDTRQTQRKSAPKLSPLDHVVSIFSNLATSDQAIAPRRERAFSPPRRTETEQPLSPRREGQEPVGRTLEMLLSITSRHEREKRFMALSNEERRRVKKKLVELCKEDEPTKATAHAFPAPKQQTMRERSSSLEKFSLRLFSPPRVRESATSPPRARATSPTPSQKNVRKDDKEKQPLSPHRQRELSPPPRQAVSPRKSQRASSPTPEEKIAGLRQRSSSQALEPAARPNSPTRARVVEPPRVYKSDLSAEQISRAQELLQYYANLKIESRKRALLLAIEANNYDPKAKQGEEKPVWNLLALANESVIPTAELFEIIQKSLEKDREDEIQAKRVKSYLNFSLNWLDSNRQNKLFEQALPYLTEIARLAMLHSDAECKALAERLIASLQAPLELHVRQPLSRTTSVSNHEFEMIIREITSGSLDKPYEALAELVSLDLFLQLKQLFQAMSAHDLIEKWPTPSKKNKSTNRFTNFFNAFSGFIIDTLLQKNLNAQQRACIMKFFVHVAFKSASLGDLTTPMMIISALDNVATKKLQAALKLLNNDTFDIGFLRKVQGNDSQLPDRVTTLSAIEVLMNSFHPLPNWRKVRQLQAMLQEQRQFFIPYVPLIFSDLEFLKQNPPVIERENSYNFEKLQLLYDKTAQVFACRDMPIPGRISLELFQTDLFVKVITDNREDAEFVYANAQPDDEARYQEAKRRNEADL